MRKFGVILGVVLMSAIVAQGAVLPNLQLWVNTTGQAEIRNLTGPAGQRPTVASITVPAYTIHSTTNQLIPVVAGWVPPVMDGAVVLEAGFWQTATFAPASTWAPIWAYGDSGNQAILKAAAPAGPGAFANTTAGSNAINAYFMANELANSASYLSELSSGTTFMAVKTPAAGISLGKIMAAFTPGQVSALQASTSFEFVTGGVLYQGEVLFVPEPATMSLLVLGGIATLIRRRRR